MSVEIDEFPAIFAGGVDPKVAEVLGHSQRPLAASVFGEAAPVAAWKTKPAGASSRSRTTPSTPTSSASATSAPASRRVEVAGAPHLVMHQNPQAVVDIIETALAGVKLPA